MTIRNLIKKYDGKTVVNSISFDIPKGKVISMIGPNGAGKSTVLNIISRLIARDSGEVNFEGADVVKWKSRELAKRLAILTPVSYTHLKHHGQSQFPRIGNDPFAVIVNGRLKFFEGKHRLSKGFHHGHTAHIFHRFI